MTEETCIICNGEKTTDKYQPNWEKKTYPCYKCCYEEFEKEIEHLRYGVTVTDYFLEE